MNCTHCNAELPENAKVCEYCDCAVETKENGKLLRIILGVLCALASLLLIFMPTICSGIVGNSTELLAKLMASGYGGITSTVVAYTTMSNAMIVFDNFVYPAAGLMMAVTALALLLKRKGAYKAAVISGIAGFAAAAYSVLMMIVVRAFPQSLVALYSYNEEVVEIAVNIARGEFSFTLKYIVGALITAAVTVPMFIFALKAKRSADPELCGKMERSTASLMTFLPLVGIALRVRGLFSNVYAAKMGQNALAANSIAETTVASVISISSVMLLIITVYCVLMKKLKYPLFILPGLGGLSTYGIIALFRWKGLLNTYLYGVSDDIYAMARQAIIPKILGTLFLLIAVYFWIAATARGGIRAWGQIIFAVSFIFIGIILEAMKVAVLLLGIAVPLTEIVLGLAMLSAAIPLSIRRREV